MPHAMRRSRNTTPVLLALLFLIGPVCESAGAQQEEHRGGWGRQFVAKHCGDGTCQRWEERHNLCPQDCGSGASGEPAASVPEGVPREFQPIYAELERQLSQLAQRLPAGGEAPVIFSACLLAANSNEGERLLIPEMLDSVMLSLDRMQALGQQAVSLDVNFPLLYRGFHPDETTFQRYLDFYRRVAQEIRQRGLKLCLESSQIFTASVWSPLEVEPFYKSLTLEEYVEAKSEMVRTIAKELQPDFFTVAEEPDTEARETGQPMDDLDQYIPAVNRYVAEARQVGPERMRIGAGFGTWLRGYETFAQRLAAETKVDFINLHVYPVHRQFMDRLVEVAELARQHGKGVVVGEAWLYKLGTNELGRANEQLVYGRDVYSFWVPLDAKFLEVLVQVARSQGFEYVSPFWSRYFFGYLPYDERTKALPPQQAFRAVNRIAAEAMRAGTVSASGAAYQQLIQGDASP